MQRVKKFRRNEAGRDFVVGDIHGAFDLIAEGMRRVAFNPARDRLFAVGDLIDRGPESPRCIAFLAQPYIHSVRGNHEQLLLDLYANGEPDTVVLKFMANRNGFGWWLETPQATRQGVLAAVSDLPLAMEIETHRGTVGIAHADIPKGMNWQEFVERLEAGDEATIETCLWGRDRLRKKDDSGVLGIDRVFVGHSVQRDGAARLGNVYAVDTGAAFGLLGGAEEGRLTLATLTCVSSVLVSPAEKRTLVDLRNADPGGAQFGTIKRRASTPH